MKKELTKEAFEKLLAWLDPDRDTAGLIYESIRTRVTKILVARGCPRPLEIVDEAFDRIAAKLECGQLGPSNNPRNYVMGVARKVCLEFLRKPSTEELTEGHPLDDRDSKAAEECMDKCLQKIPSDERSLILLFYHGDKSVRIQGRKALAKRLGISRRALRLKAFRIRRSLEPCVFQCLSEFDGGGEVTREGA